MVLGVILSCNNPVVTPDLENHAPYNIIGPLGIQTVPIFSSIDVGLIIDKINNQDDPDGDTVILHFYMDSTSILPENQHYISASWNGEGVFNVSWSGYLQGESIVFNFWTEDSDGLISSIFTISFIYEVIT